MPANPTGTPNVEATVLVTPLIFNNAHPSTFAETKLSIRVYFIFATSL
jgi:hypothetical protein